MLFFQHPNLPAINYKHQKTAAFNWNLNCNGFEDSNKIQTRFGASKIDV
jgi:hypothetical protein